MAKESIIQTLIGDVERLMKLHDSAMEEVAALREKSGEQSEKIRTLQEQLREAKAETEKAALPADDFFNVNRPLTNGTRISSRLRSLSWAQTKASAS